MVGGMLGGMGCRPRTRNWCRLWMRRWRCGAASRGVAGVPGRVYAVLLWGICKSTRWMRSGCGWGWRRCAQTEPELAAEIERRARLWIEVHGAEFPGDSGDRPAGRDGCGTGTVRGVCERGGLSGAGRGDGAMRCVCVAADDLPGVWAARSRMGDGEALGHCELCFHGASEDEVQACEMPVPHELEAEVLDEVGELGRRWWRLRCCRG
jgi:hypothetical protein